MRNFKWVDREDHFENMISEPKLERSEGNVAFTSGTQ